MENSAKSVYETLSAIDCRKESRKKNGLTYLPWAWAWARVKEHFPLATYTIYEDAAGRFYHTDGKTAWVKTGVTIEGVELIEYLPVMDFRNASIPLEKLTSFDVNKSIQRSLTKACARHGLGLYIFAGEDIPEGADDSAPEAASRQTSEKGPVVAPGAAPCADTSARRGTPQGGSAAASAAKEAAMAAWRAFRRLGATKTMDENSRSRYFLSLLRANVGKADAKDVTAEEWAKFEGDLKAMGVA